MQEITVKAAVDSLPVVTDFINEQLEALHCSMKVQNQIGIALDELFGNIAHYAYPDGEGEAVVSLEASDTSPCIVTITLSDWGVPYNPLEKSDPDITLSAEDREIGGLGIFLSKKLMDDLKYEYKDQKNILRITKTLG